MLTPVIQSEIIKILTLYSFTHVLRTRVLTSDWLSGGGGGGGMEEWRNRQLVLSFHFLGRDVDTISS